MKLSQPLNLNSCTSVLEEGGHCIPSSFSNGMGNDAFSVVATVTYSGVT